MEKGFDFNKIGKRMPYQVPDGFFDQLEENVWQEVKKEPVFDKGKRFRRIRMAWGSLAALAATVALLLLIRPVWIPAQADNFSAVEEAFSHLCLEDQDYLFEIYQEDVFLNE